MATDEDNYHRHHRQHKGTVVEHHREVVVVQEEEEGPYPHMVQALDTERVAFLVRLLVVLEEGLVHAAFRQGCLMFHKSPMLDPPDLPWHLELTELLFCGPGCCAQ